LVALAPLTNVATAVAADPLGLRHLKELVLMGGNVEGVGNTSTAAEFNFLADPEAAHLVLDRLKRPIRIASWELCFKYVHFSLVNKLKLQPKMLID